MGDLDVIDYGHWARNIRGLADTTIKGHASPTTTAGYTRMSAAASGKLVAAMDAMVLESST